MLEIVCWKWKPKTLYRSHFGPETVNVLRRMVARNLKLPHRFTCVTDDPRGIDPEVRIVPLWEEFGNLPNPSGPHNPSCYRRLKIFGPEAKELFGERIVSMDLDTVITGDLTPLFDRDDDFVIWGGQQIQPGRKGSSLFCWYNGSLMMIKAGARPQVWDKFNPKTSPWEAHRANSRGSDQGWISHILGKDEKIWTDKDGVYSFRNQIYRRLGGLPLNCKVISFHGKNDPWQPEMQAVCPWIKEYYH